MCKKGSGRRKRELTEPNIRNECVDCSREEIKKKHKSEGGTALACRSLHLTDTAIGDTLQVDGKRATLQDATRERPRRSEMPITDEAGRGRRHIDLGEDRVIGKTVGDGLRVREVDRHELWRLRRRRRAS